MKKLIFTLAILGSLSTVQAATNLEITPFINQATCKEGGPLLTDYTNNTFRLIYPDSMQSSNISEKSISIPMSLRELAIPLMGLTLTVSGSELDFPERIENGIAFNPYILGMDNNHTTLKVEFSSIQKVAGNTFGFGGGDADSGFVELIFYKNSNSEKTLREIHINRTTIDPQTKRKEYIVKDCYVR